MGDFFPTKTNERLFVEGNVESLFDPELQGLFNRADISVCNLEGTLTRTQEPTLKLGPNIKADPESLNLYKKIGISLLATANNHVTDFCQQGYLDTESALEQYGIPYIGSGRNASEIKHYASYELAGQRICIYNVAETMFNIPTSESAGVHLYDEYLVCKELEALKKSSDVLVVLYHGGVEYFPYPTPELKKRFHRMADSGADVILAQHTHCIGCEERYNGSFLLYGQGNFLFDRPSPHECVKTGLAIELVLEDGTFCVDKHMVSVHNGSLKYVSDPDFGPYDERSSHADDDEFLICALKDFALTQKSVKTKQFRKVRFYDKTLRRILPRKVWHRFEESFRTVNFTKPQLMRILYTVRSEQQRETALYLVLKELEMIDGNNDGSR